ncbi:MAG: monovalent cation/H+ antiporter subunit D family protein [Opitutales bacterium]
MEPITDPRLLVAILTPLLGAGLIMLAGKRPNLREGLSLLAALSLFGAVLSLAPRIRAGDTLTWTLFELLPGLSFTLRADALSMVFALSASFLWILAVCYSAGYMRGLGEHAQTRFGACFALALFGAIGCAFSDNLLTLYLFYEIVSITTYPLVAHHQDREGYAGGRKYLAYLTATAKALVLPAMVLLYVLNGNLDFAHDASEGVLAGDIDRWVVTGLYIAFLIGFAKNGLMPLHQWLPGAMVAPTPVSALLHAVAVVKVGVFATVRVMLYIFGTETMAELNLGLPTAWFVSITIILASLIALGKDDLKARLAYSTVSQLAYIILGVALLTPYGIAGGIIHIANHAFAKITLFFCAGAIYVAARRKKISEMHGLGRAMPWTFAAFGIASLSMIGVPGAAGFITKWHLLLGSWDAGSMGLILVLLTSSLLNAAYFGPIVYHGFFGQPPAESESPDQAPAREASPLLVVPLVITAVISVLIGLFPAFFMQFVQQVLP